VVSVKSARCHREATLEEMGRGIMGKQLEVRRRRFRLNQGSESVRDHISGWGSRG